MISLLLTMKFVLSGYSFIKKPYECLIFAAFESVTTALMTVSAMTYSAQLGTIQTLGTIQGIVGGSYYGMGQSKCHDFFKSHIMIFV